MPQANDWAVIVGIQMYPGLDDPTSPGYLPLLGPVNDATAFAEWACSCEGGDVPKENVTLIRQIYSSLPSVDEARPIDEDIRLAFKKHYDRGINNGLHAGRRLYIYMAGHGIEVPPNQPALLMANAAPRQFNNHFLGRGYADWFFRAGFFDEILLFMDCCRDNFPLAQPNNVKFDPLNVVDAVDRVRYLYGFGTKWSRRSRERSMDGVTRGVFSAALLAGLKGGAADRQGQVTAASLRQFLYDHMRDFADPADLVSARVTQQPDFDPWPRDERAAEQFVIVPAGRITALEYLVRIALPPAVANQQMTIQDNEFYPHKQFVAQPPEYRTSLPEGLYQILVVGSNPYKPFKVSGRVAITAEGKVVCEGGVDVNLV